MAGKRSPWGNGGNKDDGGEGTPDGDEPASPAAPVGSDEPTSPSAAPDTEQPRAPRNPWAQGGTDDGQQRRSASIEDIFRARPGGPRKGGGGGGGGRGGFPGLPPRADGKSWVPRIAGIAALAWIALTSFHVLGQKEQGVVTTLGKFSRIAQPGWNVTLPWPIQSVDSRDVTTIILTKVPDSEAEKLVLTSDQNLVDLSYQVRWKIKNLEQFTYELSDPEATVSEVAEAAMRASVAEMPINAVWGGSGRGELQDNVRTRMQQLFDAYRAGIQVLGVEIKKADPPAKVADAFQQVNNAKQDAQRYINQAQGYAQQKINQAQGDVAQFDPIYAQYKANPDVTRRRLYYETMERVLSNNEKVVVEANGVTPYLPLPEVRRKAPQAEVEAGQ